MGGSFTVARIAGIPIRIHVSWIIVLGLLTWSLAESVFPDLSPGWSKAAYWITGAIAALCLFLSVLVHELSHSFVARARGQRVEGITLFIFGGVSQIEEEPTTPGGEFQVAIVGPLTSIALSVVFLVLTPVGGAISKQVKALFEYLATINLLVGLFNLIPGFPLDGGRVLRSIVWRRTRSIFRATVTAVVVSRAVAFVMIFGGVLAIFATGSFEGLWIAFIGWFLDNAASSSLQQLSVHRILGGVRVREAMRGEVQTVVPALPVSSLVEDYIATGHQRSFPVFGGGRLWGIVSLSDVAKLPRDRWQETRVEQIMTPRERLRSVDADDLLEHVVGDLQHAGVSQLPVLAHDPERVIGMIGRADLMDFLQVRQLLAQDGIKT
jgi:Zn-dependent protease